MLARLSLLALAILGSPAIADEVALARLPGQRIDANWFRYVNPRFGTAIDIPTKGYRYDVPVNSSGLALTSERGEVTITIYSHWVASVFDKDHPLKDVGRSVSRAFDEAADETRKAGGTIAYSVKKNTFYVMSGTQHDGAYTYYERFIVSPRCPAVFNEVRVFYASTKDPALDRLVTRLSRSLRATCRGAENAGDLSWISNDGLKPEPASGVRKPR